MIACSEAQTDVQNCHLRRAHKPGTSLETQYSGGTNSQNSTPRRLEKRKISKEQIENNSEVGDLY